MLRNNIQRILVEYARARQEMYERHPLAELIRNDVKNDVTTAIGQSAVGLRVLASAGAGKWATVPWIAVLDLAVTDRPTRGYYVVYLFHADNRVVHLSLNQGATAVREEFRRATRAVLKDRAATIRHRISEYSNRFSERVIALGSRQTLPADYESGHAIGVTYNADALPPEESLRDDLLTLVEAYRVLTFRGGFELSMEGEDVGDNTAGLRSKTLIEKRQYRYHRRIERNRSAASEAKLLHGTRCLCCGFDFEAAFGDVGAGYIEAHHLKPLASLVEGEPIEYNIARDFTVLCANCHRMIHRLEDVADLAGLKARRRKPD